MAATAYLTMNGKGGKTEAGFSYLSLLFAVTLIGIGLAVAGHVWSTDKKREREAELLFRGAEIRRAIGRYYEESPGAKAYPKSLEELVLDKRYPVTKRHLRKVYTDPFTGNADWELIKSGDGIMGVKSRSTEAALKKKNFPKELSSFESKEKYNEWEFQYTSQSYTVDKQ